MKYLSLKTLKELILNGTRTVMFRSDDGSESEMVYIPKFTVPQGLWDNGKFPAKDLDLGGFFVDKYQASHKSATSKDRGAEAGKTVLADSADDVAVSLPGRVVWGEIAWEDAKKACSNRKINGVPCHLMTMKEWVTIVFIAKILEHEPKGNNNWGRDYRDQGHASHGVKDPIVESYSTGYGREMARVLTGTGPNSWSHNNLANGVFDLMGNVWEWIDFRTNDGIYTHIKTASISDVDGISINDVAIVLKNVVEVGNWPQPGLVLIKAEGTNTDEYVSYETLTVNSDKTVTLNGCMRGQNGTNASAHNDGALVDQISKYCIIPGGSVAYIDKFAGIDGVMTEIPYKDLILGPGCLNINAGDICQLGKEQVEVTENTGNLLRVNRGINGITESHAENAAIIKLSPQMKNEYDSSNELFQSGYFKTLRSENDLISMALPSEVSSSKSTEWKDMMTMCWVGERVAARGGFFGSGAYANTGLILDLMRAPNYNHISRGFRACLKL